MKYAAFVDLFDTETAHIVGFNMKDLRWFSLGKFYALVPRDIKKHYVFLGRSSDIKKLFDRFNLEKPEIKNTYEEAQRDLIDAIFTQND